MKRVLFLSGVLLVCLLAFGVWRVFLRPRGGGFGPVGTIEKIAHNLYAIPGAGGNTVVFVTAGGVVLIDTKVAGSGQKIVDQVRTVTDKPVKFVINTHSHGDHTGGNTFFPAAVEIVAHENTATNMKKMSNFLFGWRRDALPDRTYRDRLRLLDGNDAVDLYYFGPAHTDGDSFVVFPAAHVMHIGDVIAEKAVPRIYNSNGSGGVAYAKALHRALAEITGVSTIITSHGGRMTWTEFVEYVEFADALVEAARHAHAAGRTWREAAAEVKLSSRFERYDLTGAPGMFEAIYNELGKQN